MKKTIISALALLPALCTFGQQQQRPNFIFIMSDDHGRQAISAFGHPLSQVAPTPNIDRIAQNGALFMNNFSGNSISGPSRATILTGKHSHKHGFTENDGTDFDGSQQTLQQILREHGYQTAIIGKWHLGSYPTGFDFWKVLDGQGEYYNPFFITEQDTTRHWGHVTDLITNYSIDWLENRNKEKPFFLKVHHKAPHRHFMPAERHWRLFEHTVFPMPESFFDNFEGRRAAAHQRMSIARDLKLGYDLKITCSVDSYEFIDATGNWVMRREMTEDQQKRFFRAFRERNNDFHTTPRTEKELAKWKFQRFMQDYMATVRGLDEGIGVILDYLEASGLMENTVIIYTTDQGFFLGEHGWFDKRFMYEESFQMPLLMSHYGHIPGGTIVHGLTQNIDFAPTFLDMAGIDVPSDMQGVSFKEMVRTGETPRNWRRAVYYHYFEYPGPHYVKAHFGVRTERHKLIYFYEAGFWELYDLKRDPTEINNIYGRFGTRRLTRQLRRELIRLQEQYEVPERYRSWHTGRRR
jgi:uncharacterized sulfatase